MYGQRWFDLKQIEKLEKHIFCHIQTNIIQVDINWLDVKVRVAELKI